MTDENDALQTSRSAVRPLADVATDDDKLFHDGCVQGIAKFIKECATPMTIAIQGDWGTGKTTLINLIEAQLRSEAEIEEEDEQQVNKYCKNIIGTVTVDVWHHSIANPRADLFEFLLREVILKLSGSSMTEIREVSEFATVASQILGASSATKKEPEEESALDSILNSLFGSEDEKKSESEDAYTSYEDINALKAMFVDALQKYAEEYGKSEDSRIVVFVDGMDHISPEDVIDLLEKIRAYLNCPRCVFVLAADEKSVLEGAKKRLGDKAEEVRKKQFFGKLVQVPLRIPSGEYNLDKYIKDLLKDEKELSGEFANVVKILVKDPTPSQIKRYINLLYLYRGIFDGSESAQDDSLPMLLASIILETESTQGFNIVAKCVLDDGSPFGESVKEAIASQGLSDGINWARLPALWGGEDGAEGDAAKKRAFISWIRRLK